MSNKSCSRCKKKFSTSNFISRDIKTFKTTILCYKCRFYNAAKFISKEQNSKELILIKLYNEKIYKVDLYNIYLAQKRKCYLCLRKVNIPLLYVNKFDNYNNYYNNIFLSCCYCYSLYDDDSDVNEFSEMLKETNYPFNKSNIRIRKNYVCTNRRSFIKQLLGSK
jgi:hypothetical protein